MLRGFRDFVLRGNVIDLAVAVVVGAAFGAVVTALTERVLQPLVNAVGSPRTGGLGFEVRAGVPSTFVDLGAVITAAVNFVLVAAVVYVAVVTPMNRLLALRKRDEVEEPASPPEDVQVLQEIRELLRRQVALQEAGAPPAGPGGGAGA
ncbi:large conductance mechanosensitive channel protein MscL [Vallicoccus soli]|uniref:Large-conductance mechanosensitive channel n=1 Tax=Vallicoccus soli TaxID=2339232 RepID=A0A3A3Z341_9ACTN|nr:large conductance mechanosensitive channel protein MscL [Vallicoccus soli]RJK97834.1 large conductance mechanosensitive channel protein MscL [Vallicoccus soli]